MSFPHEAVAALGGATGTADANKLLIRSMATKRFPFALASTENGGDLVATDPLDSSVPLYLVQDGTLYQLDPLDTTTAAGATCIVTNDNLRYKSGGIDYPWSVLDKDTVAQPVSPAPSVGDRYLIPAAATGTDWAGKDGKVGIFTAGGWRFATVPIGRLLYVEDETRFYHRNASGTWTAGVGSFPIGDRSITLNHVLGANASFVIKVENQTTNAQPADPVAPTAYIIGPSPTGAVWSGNPGKLAICFVDGTWTVVDPAEGDQVYDKALNIPISFNGTAWVSAAGSVVGFFRNPLVAVSTALSVGSGSGYYAFSPTTAPTTGTAQRIEPVDLVVRAPNDQVKLEFRYQGVPVWATQSASVAEHNPTIALFRDNLTDAIAWHPLCSQASYQSVVSIDETFIVDAPDDQEHNYRVSIFYGAQSDLDVIVSHMARREFTCKILQERQ